MDTHTLDLEAGQTGTVKATVTGVTPAPAVTYSSSNTRTASVDRTSGVITAHSAGTATITASVTVNGRTYTDACEVTVEDNSSEEPGGSTGSGGNQMTATYVPENGRVTSYCETWSNGNFQKIEVSGSTITFSGRRDDLSSLFNYVVLKGYGYAEDSEPFVPGQAFSISIDIDVAGLAELYKHDTSVAKSFIFGGYCQNFKPGDSGTAGIGFFVNYSSIALALNGNGGLELQLYR